MDITNISAYEMHEKFLNKEVTAVELVNAHLENMEKLKELNAFITINKEDALERAKILDEKLASGAEMGVLAGIPISLKDNISTKGIRTTCGSKMLENYIPPFNATVVDLIEAEDGIILGKTNLDEFAIGSSTESSYFGATKNPVDNNLIAGGSSGGSTVAVKSRQMPLSLGTDTGGSVRQPASYCNVVGIKPTYGAISRFGVVSMANTMDQVGVVGRNVRDTSLLLKTLMKKDTRDGTSYKKSEEVLKNLDVNKNYDFKGIKVGVLKTIGDYKLDEIVARDFEKAVEMVKSMGGQVEEISMDSLKYAPACYHVLSTAEVSSNLARFDGLRYGYRSEKYETTEELFRNSRQEALGKEVKRRILFGTYVLLNENKKEYYEKALKVRRLIADEYSEMLSKYDVLMTPTTPTIPFELGTNSDNTEIQYNSDIFTVGVNLAGICAISVPFDKEEAAPVGIQFIANKFEEDKLIKAGLAFEGGNVYEL